MAIVESLKKLFIFFQVNEVFINKYYEQFMDLVDTIGACGGHEPIGNVPVLVNKNLERQGVDPPSAGPAQLAKAHAEVREEVLVALLLSGVNYYKFNDL